MCTAVSYSANNHYFGRNLDYDQSYNEKIVITPRNYLFQFRNGLHFKTKYGIIGIAAVADSYPLYFDACNEAGLSMAGLNFPDNAYYFPFNHTCENITPFELIPYLLGSCNSAEQACKLLKLTSIWAEPFSNSFPLSPLHWIISDRNRCFVIESTRTGLSVYENKVGVLTNSPPFPYQLYNLSNYMQLTPEPPENKQPVELPIYSFGLGSFGLPGDMSSSSRFVKAAYTKFHSLCGKTENSEVSQFFHILASVSQPCGATKLPNGRYEYTMYSSCYNTEKCICYYTTYENSRVYMVDLFREDLDTPNLIVYPMIHNDSFCEQNFISHSNGHPSF